MKLDFRKLALLLFCGTALAQIPHVGGSSSSGSVTGGSCPAGQYATSISSAGVPTCAVTSGLTSATGTGAASVSLSGGALTVNVPVPTAASVGAQKALTPLASYLGQVATRSIVPNYTNGTQLMARSIHFARQPLGSVAVCEANWTLSAGVETPTGGVLTAQAAIEYPLGTNVGTVTWSGSSSGTLASGITLCSDQLIVNIPDGAEFAVRRYLTSTTAVPFVYGNVAVGSSSLGDALAYGSSGVTNVVAGTGTGTFSGNYVGQPFSAPVAIVAQTTRRSVCLYGDSKQEGYTDPADAVSGDIGEIGRALGPYMGTINIGVPNETLAQFVASNSLKLSLLRYCSDVSINYGINDATGGQTLAQFETNVRAAALLFTGKNLWWSTLAPYTNSGNTAVNNTVRVQYNPFLMNTGLANFAPVDIRRVLEGNPSGGTGFSGLWGSASWTSDGVHETALGNQVIRDSGVVQQTILQ